MFAWQEIKNIEFKSKNDLWCDSTSHDDDDDEDYEGVKRSQSYKQSGWQHSTLVSFYSTSLSLASFWWVQSA